MKAFEEWFHTTDEYRYCESEDTDLVEMGWRAALEWTLEHREMGHTVNLRRVIPTEVIEQELED